MKTEGENVKSVQSESNEPNMEIYNAALLAARYEGTLLWQIFSVFLIIHTAIVGFVTQGIDANLATCKDFRVFLASLVGISLCLLWAATYSRNASHYRYYLARARENEPANWHLYGGGGKDFSHGKPVTHAGRLPLPARWVKSGRMIPPVICVFLSVYIFGLTASSIGCFTIKQKRNILNSSLTTNAVVTTPSKKATNNIVARTRP